MRAPAYVVRCSFVDPNGRRCVNPTSSTSSPSTCDLPHEFFPDPVNHPPHYQQVPGVECIDVVEHFPFLRGNAIKYLWRAGAKGDVITDLEKARWYIDREIANLRKQAAS